MSVIVATANNTNTNTDIIINTSTDTETITSNTSSTTIVADDFAAMLVSVFNTSKVLPVYQAESNKARVSLEWLYKLYDMGLLGSLCYELHREKSFNTTTIII